MADGDDPPAPRPPAYLPESYFPRAGCHFLEAVARRVPAVLDDLYATAYVPHAAHLPGRQDIRLYSFLCPLDRPRPLADRFRDPVDAWADRWFLLGDPAGRRGHPAPRFHAYLRGVALDAVLEWHWGMVARGTWRPFDPTAAFEMLEDHPPVFQPALSGWAMLRDSEPEFRRHARREFASRLDAYVRGRRAALEGKRDRAGAMYRPAADYPQRNHFDFLASYQAGGLPRGRIARESVEDPRTVRKWTERAAAEVVGREAVAWWLRPSPRGRPRKYPAG